MGRRKRSRMEKKQDARPGHDKIRLKTMFDKNQKTKYKLEQKVNQRGTNGEKEAAESRENATKSSPAGKED